MTTVFMVEVRHGEYSAVEWCSIAAFTYEHIANRFADRAGDILTKLACWTCPTCGHRWGRHSADVRAQEIEYKFPNPPCDGPRPEIPADLALVAEMMIGIYDCEVTASVHRMPLDPELTP